MKKLSTFLITVVVAVLIFGLLKNSLVQAVLVQSVKAMTGLGAEVRGVNVDIVKNSVRLEGLKVFNPSGFTDRLMADFPEIRVRYDLGGFLKGKVHLEDLLVDLKEFTVIRNAKNQVNVKSLKTLLPRGGGKPVQIQIDDLHLKIGRVVYKDDSMGQSQVKEFNVNIHEEYRNITDPDALANLIVVKALSKSGIAGLAGVDVNALKKDISGAVGTQVEGTLQRLKEKASETLQKLFPSTQ